MTAKKPPARELASRRSARGKVARMNQERETLASRESTLPVTKAGSENYVRSDLGPAGVAALEALTPRQRFRNEIDEQTRAINKERAAKGQPPLALFADSSRANGTDDQKLDAFIDRLSDRADSGEDPFLYVGSGEVNDDGVSLTVKKMVAVLPKTLPVDAWERESIAVHEWQRTLLLPGQQASVAQTPQQPAVPMTPEEQRLALLRKAERHQPARLISQKLRRGM